jgi:SAM-dependent methyltransferase
VLDLGCGPGDLIRQLWDVRYVGVDLNVPYIQRARRVYGDRAEFRVGDATRLDGDLRDFDLALAFGVLHHLDDGAATALCRAAARALVPGGRLVAVDPALIPAQHPVARFLITRDRGQYVRSPSDYGDIAQGVFTDAKVVVRNDLLRIPYTHCVIEATT